MTTPIQLQTEAFKKYLDKYLPCAGEIKGVSPEELRDKLISLFVEGAEGEIGSNGEREPGITNFSDNVLFTLGKFEEWLRSVKNINGKVVEKFCLPLYKLKTDEMLENMGLREKKSGRLIDFPKK